MKILALKIAQSMVPIFVLISFLSCSKDTDLLADYVVSDFQEARFISNLAIGDNFVVVPQKSIVLDVLANDTFTDPDKINIVETSQPTNGTVVINEDKTLTYYPDSADAPNSNTSNGISNSQLPSEKDLVGEEISSPAEIVTAEETSQEEETLETATQPEDETEAKEEQEEVVTEIFDYSVESTDEKGIKTTQQATVTVTTDLGGLKAFPSAEGYGKNATGGRGGFVYHVTNLGDSGPGSLRQGVEKVMGTRTIVFEVSGYINLSKPLKIRKGYGNLTIAGQTAPGDGITLKGSSLWIHDSNVIIRYLRIRPGKAYLPAGTGDSSSGDYEPDDAVKIRAWSGTTIKNIIMDHCSISWGRDGLLDIAGSTTGYLEKISIQNCIVAENVDKGYGTLVDNHVAEITFFKNLYAHNNERNILYKNDAFDVQFVNNIIYNFKRGTGLSYRSRADIIGNVYLTNSTTNRHLETIRLGTGDGITASPKLYQYDNTEDGVEITLSNKGTNNVLPFLHNSPVAKSNGLKLLPNERVVAAVLSKVGASVYRDGADSRVIDDVHNRTGSRILHENEVNGFPTLKSIARSYDYDRDKDGMSDKWEITNNLNQSDPYDGNEDANGDGYTNLESFLYSLTNP